MTRRQPARTGVGLAALCAALLSTTCTVAAEVEWKDEGRLVAPELDLEVWVSTALRLSPEHTEMYAEKLLALARELFGVTGHAPAKLDRRPTWCVTIDHGGTIDLGKRAILRTARGKVYRGGQFVGGGEERRWILPVRRRCTLRVALYKRVDDGFISGLKFAFREPPTWDEQLCGGIPVATQLRVAGEKEPACPITLEEAQHRALEALEPPRQATMAAIYARLLGLEIDTLRDVRGATVRGRQKLGLYTAHLIAHNHTPWFIHAIRGTHFGTYHGDAIYRVELAFDGAIPPGRKQTFPCQATDLEGADEPPDGAITTVRWSLKGEP